MKREHPLLRRLRQKGYTIAKLVAPPDDPAASTLAVASIAEAEAAVDDLADFVAVTDDGMTGADLEVAEDALRRIKTLIERQYDHPLLLRSLPPGDPAGDIMRIIEEALPYE